MVQFRFDELLHTLESGRSVVCVTYPFLDKYGVSQELQDRLAISLDDCYHFLFSASRETIDICSPFVDSTALLRYKDILCNKIYSDIKVRIVARELEASPEKPFGRLTSVVSFLDSKNTGNLEIYEYHYTGLSGKLLSSIHAKFIVVDNKFGYMGSADIKETSLVKNLEVGILTGDPNIVDVLNTLFKELVRISTKLGTNEGRC